MVARTLTLCGALAALAVLGAWLATADAQEEKTKTGSTVERTDVARIWNFHFEGLKKKGEVLELEQLDKAEHRGRALVITHLETRTPQSLRFQVIEHRQLKQAREDAPPAWKKEVRRGEAFSEEFITAQTSYAGSTYDARVGMRFDPHTRPGLEITRGSGEIWVYAEGYWSK